MTDLRWPRSGRGDAVGNTVGVSYKGAALITSKHAKALLWLVVAGGLISSGCGGGSVRSATSTTVPPPPCAPSTTTSEPGAGCEATTSTSGTGGTGGPSASADGVTITAVLSRNDPANSEWEIQLKITNASTTDYTIVPGTDLYLVGTGGESLDLLNEPGTGPSCYGVTADTQPASYGSASPDYTTASGQTLLLPTTFCFATHGSFAPAHLKIQGSTPATYMIPL